MYCWYLDFTAKNRMRSIFTAIVITFFIIFKKSFETSLIIFFRPLRFEVSKIVWECLMNKCMELRHLKHKYGPFGSKKSSGRYRPYSNVDSFLKVILMLLFFVSPHNLFIELIFTLF